MKLLSFFLSEPLDKARLAALGKIVKDKKPEFLALQNVKKDSIENVSKTDWGSRFNVIHPIFRYENRMKPTVALFSTYPAQDSDTIDYHETVSGRVMEKGYYVMHDKNNKPFVICVSTTSLEHGLKVSELREKQLNEACLNLRLVENAFLIGNMCIDSDVDGKLEFQGGWTDAWLSLPGNTEMNGYTYHPDKNPLIKNDPFGPGRPDRLFFKSRNYRLDWVELVGVEPHQLSSGVGVTISKHYGILAQFTPLDEGKPKVESPIVSVLFQRGEWEKFKENQPPQEQDDQGTSQESGQDAS